MATQFCGFTCARVNVDWIALLLSKLRPMVKALNGDLRWAEHLAPQGDPASGNPMAQRTCRQIKLINVI